MPLLSLVALALCRPAAQAANPGRRVALVVGVNTYSNDPGINALSYAVADANSVAEAFNKLKFDVVVKLTTDETEPQLQPTSDNVIQRLELLAKTLKKEDTFVFYFSGHGFQFPNEDGQKETFLATSNALRTGYLTISRTMVSLDVMKKAMSQVKAERRVFIIDACRTNPVKPTATPGTKDPIQGMDDKFKKDLITVQEAGLQNPGQAVLLACKPGASSFEIPTLKHGYYTYFLLKALEQPGSANGNGDILPSTLHAATEQLMADYAAVSGKEQVPDSALTGSLNWSLGRRPVAKVTDPDKPIPGPSPEPAKVPDEKPTAYSFKPSRFNVMVERSRLKVGEGDVHARVGVSSDGKTMLAIDERGDGFMASGADFRSQVRITSASWPEEFREAYITSDASAIYARIWSREKSKIVVRTPLGPTYEVPLDNSDQIVADYAYCPTSRALAVVLREEGSQNVLYGLIQKEAFRPIEKKVLTADPPRFTVDGKAVVFLDFHQVLMSSVPVGISRTVHFDQVTDPVMTTISKAWGTGYLTGYESVLYRIHFGEGKVDKVAKLAFRGAKAMELSQDGTVLVCISNDNEVFMVDPKDGALLGQISRDADGTGFDDVVFLPDNRRIAVACDDGSVRIYEPKSILGRSHGE